MKMLRLTVASCGDCPFLSAVEDAVKTEGGAVFPEGWFCMHKQKSGYVLLLREAGEMALRDWLKAQYGRPFPHDCPLPDAQFATAKPGPRSLDLQPVVGG